MAEDDAIIVKREFEVVVTPQALRILKHTHFSVEEFVDWSLRVRRFSLGGNNVCLFLEEMHAEDES